MKKEIDFAQFAKEFFPVVNPTKKLIDNWHLNIICAALQEVQMGKIKRLMINVPPRSLKSYIVSVAWPAWLLGADPTCRIMAASYSCALANKHSADCRYLMNSEKYQKIFAECSIKNGDDRKEKFITTKRGFRFATSVGGTVTGEGGDILIVDDPHNAVDISSSEKRDKVKSWFAQSFVSRLDNKKDGAIVVVMQRLHNDDLAGYLLETQPDLWHKLVIPSVADASVNYQYGNYSHDFKKGELLHADREGDMELKRAMLELGDQNYEAQYLQRPSINENGLITKDLFRYFTNNPEPNPILTTISVDPAIKSGDDNSYSVISVWQMVEDKHYLLEIHRARLNYPMLKTALVNLVEKYSPKNILIEDKASGCSLIQDFRFNKIRGVIPVNPRINKFARFSKVSGFFSQNKVFFKNDAIWLKDLENELLTFPDAKFDDQVDSISQYLEFVQEHRLKGRTSGLRIMI
jgi:predicted phage terminase large subunit-like protein